MTNKRSPSHFADLTSYDSLAYHNEQAVRISKGPDVFKSLVVECALFETDAGLFCHKWPCLWRYSCASDPSDSTCCRSSLVRIPTPGRLHVTEHGSAKRTGIHDWLALASFITYLPALQQYYIPMYSTWRGGGVFFSSGCSSGRKASTCRFAE